MQNKHCVKRLLLQGLPEHLMCTQKLLKENEWHKVDRPFSTFSEQNSLQPKGVL